MPEWSSANYIIVSIPVTVRVSVDCCVVGGKGGCLVKETIPFWFRPLFVTDGGNRETVYHFGSVLCL